MMGLHLISDFFLQSRKMAENKSSSLRYLSKHCFIIFCIFYAGMFWVPGKCALWNAIIHFIIDGSIWNIYKFSLKYRDIDVNNFQYWKDKWFYNTIGIDQFLHVTTLIIIFKDYV